MSDVAPTVLSLCSGYGGLELAVRSVYRQSRVVGYVEWEAFSAAVLLARMEDATLEPAPIWCGDLAELPTAPFLGVDLITAGFSCQPWSSAGLGLGTEDERWIWPDIARLAQRVGCRALFLENVPPLIVRGGLELVLGDLASLGFDAEWTVLRAASVGATHERERVFILAYANDAERRSINEPRGCRSEGRNGPWEASGGPGFQSAVLADASSARRSEVARSTSRDESSDAGWPSVEDYEPDGSVEDVADSDINGCSRLGRQSEHDRIARHDVDGRGSPQLGDTDSERRQGKGRTRASGRRKFALARTDFPPGPDDRDTWAELLATAPGLEPSLRRDADGSAEWLGLAHASVDDQLRTLGNGVVWQQAAAALRILNERMREKAA